MVQALSSLCRCMLLIAAIDRRSSIRCAHLASAALVLECSVSFGALHSQASE